MTKEMKGKRDFIAQQTGNQGWGKTKKVHTKSLEAREGEKRGFGAQALLGKGKKEIPETIKRKKIIVLKAKGGGNPEEWIGPKILFGGKERRVGW